MSTVDEEKEGGRGRAREKGGKIIRGRRTTIAAATENGKEQ